jgi:2-keto-3-deoxy-L-rhamnonate aldolase RhmA
MIPKTWENPVRARLREGKPVVGATISVASVEMAAQAAQLGFDFLWIEMEHSPITLETLREMVLATRGLPAIPFARVPVVEHWTAKRVLDAGVLGVVFPFTSTPELARITAEATKYPPNGRRGYGPRLAEFRWPAEEGYADFADRNVMTVAMIEEARAVEKIDEIAATPGIDVIFIGTADLSFSMGCRGSVQDPSVQAAIARVVAAAKAHGKYAGVPVGTLAAIQKYMEQGFLFFQGPAEVVMMATAAKQILEPLGKTGSTGKALY